MKDNNWIEDLRNKERDFELRAPEGLWDDIERSLPSAGRRRRHLVPLWLRYVGAAAAVAVCLAVVVPLLFSGHSWQEDVCMSGISGSKVSHTLVAEGRNPAGVVRDVRHPLECVVVSAGMEVEDCICIPSAASVMAALHGTLSEETDERAGKTVIEGGDTSSSAAVSDSPQRQPSSVAGSTVSERQRRKAVRAVTLTAFAGNLMAGAGSSEAGYSAVVGALSSYGAVADMPIGADKVCDILTMNRGGNIETETHHRQPLRFGLSCGIPVGGRLGIETGVTYSILSSSTVSGTEKNYFATEQTLHYIGIPLKLRYSLWETRRLGVYVSGGGMVEKCVYGTSATDFIIGSEKVSSTSAKVSEKHFQFSVVAGGGVAYRIAEALNLFVEPGLSYSFDNHGSVENSYKARPLNFDLKVGVRLDISR